MATEALCFHCSAGKRGVWLVNKLRETFFETLSLVLGITFIWQTLEKSIYGVVQPRVVDDIMVVIIGLVIFALVYKTKHD